MDNTSPIQNIPPVPSVPTIPPAPIVIISPVSSTSTPPPVIPKPPMPKKSGAILPVLVILVIVAIGYVWFQNREVGSKVVPAPTVSVSGVPAPGVTVTQGSFPLSTIPVAPSDSAITANYSATYTNHNNATQYTLDLTSPETKTALWTKYWSFLSTNGFTIATSTADQNAGTLSAIKGTSSICFIISSEASTSSVQVSYLTRG